MDVYDIIGKLSKNEILALLPPNVKFQNLLEK